MEHDALHLWTGQFINILEKHRNHSHEHDPDTVAVMYKVGEFLFLTHDGFCHDPWGSQIAHEMHEFHCMILRLGFYSIILTFAF